VQQDNGCNGGPAAAGKVARTAPVRARRRGWCRAAMAAAYALAVCTATSPAAAQGIPLIRDTEVENLLKDYSRPIFKAAGLGSHITMRIVRHESFNAFVIDGLNVFINTGTILQAKTPNEVIGVIAHETGHITGGHLAALRTRIARDQTKALLLMVLGIGLMVGSATAGGDTARDVGGVGTGVMMGGQEVLMRSLLSERRSQESAADQAGLKFLSATRQSGRGMLETFERFAQQEYVSATYQDPFVRSHPVAADRIARLRELVERSPYVDVKDPPALQLRHDMARAKISGYLERPQTVFNRYPARDKSLPARYARAIAHNCSGRCDTHLGEVDALIREKPDNPYFWELKGNLQYWSGKHRAAIPQLRKALQLAGGEEPLLQTQLAQAMLATEDGAMLGEAITLLRRSILKDATHAASHRQLATAYYRKGLYPQADLAAAQANFAEGDVKQAQIFAKRAMVKLPRGSPDWLSADDIVKYKQAKQP
jgi:predicted Zn-dependent protease